MSLLKDGSASLRFHSQELTDTELSLIKRYHRGFGFLLFKENEFSEKDVPQEDAPREGLSPSKRLCNRMFVYYKEKHGTGEGFDTWRTKQLEKIGQSYLDKLDK